MNDDLFVFRTINSDETKRRAFLGNGNFGLDISNNAGQGFGTSEIQDPFPPVVLGGVYTLSYGGDVSSPGKALLRPASAHCLVPASQSLDDLQARLDGFYQELDMKAAVARTTGTWHGYKTETTIFTSRQRPSIGAMKITFSQPGKAKGKVACSSDGESTHEFLHAIRKDPRTRYESLAFHETDGIAVLDGTVIEDGKRFRGGGPFRVIQATTIRAISSDGESIPVGWMWESKDAADTGFDGEARFVARVKVTAKLPLSIVLYFGIYKETDAPGDLGAHARADLAKAADVGFDTLLVEHENAWQAEIWSRLVEVADPVLQRRIIATMYALGCSLKQGIHNSIGPTGLNGYGWEGRVFWDADLWVNLGLLLWAPELSRCITSFRFQQIGGARVHREEYAKLCDLAGVTGGIKFPWESTTSGLERAPEGWSAQEHVTCDVIFGQYLYYTVTHDEQYLKEIAFPLVYEACTYLGQRVVQMKDGKYHYLEVVPADEHVFPGRCDDNALTNLYTGICMGIGIAWSDKFKKNYPPKWKAIKDNMFYNFDEQQQLVIEYTGYKGQPIKQADTDLLTFPLEYPFPDEVKRNNMLYYFAKLPKEHIMMSSSIFSVIACELGMADKAWEYFSDLFAHYHEDQFNIASEAPGNACWPFVTGLGGFMSNLVYCFGGIRVRPDGLLFSPFLPAQLPLITFSRLNFQGNVFRYNVQDGGRKFSITPAGSPFKLAMYFRTGKKYTCKGGTMRVKTTSKDKGETCYEVSLPVDAEATFELDISG
ncbi:MAG: glycoside hydrolase family 65 protein [Candidatus Lokiarchaeota archaeon]|nr:glycoside hydrolase family 65 protein [Candidatus Lokiarchaeota archaeon]